MIKVKYVNFYPKVGKPLIERVHLPINNHFLIAFKPLHTVSNMGVVSVSVLDSRTMAAWIIYLYSLSIISTLKKKSIVFFSFLYFFILV